MSKRLRSSEVCADCSGPDPSWASVNRGTFICDECCSVHRSLGRHVSQVRHLKHAPWPPTLLQMVETLYNNGANSIWEHSLLDPASVMSGRRKANPQDKVHPNKAEFIRAKYQMLAFVHRLPCRDDDSVTAKDLSKQLHSSVRTGNLETCLRLLSLGAQANFFHPEKGNTPLHVASKAGQILQAELLAVYGADPGTQDSSGKTPVDYARQGGHHELAERLVEIQYELTDRLAFYLCGRKPDHKNGQHFIIPQMADSSLDLSELAKAAKKKLQSLSNHLFEELAMDVYDEVDRRETDAVWLATQNHSTLVTETTVVPFLPVNPEYSSTRNQGRQKLARFNAHEFATLVIDILSDAKRRQQGSPLSGSKDNVELILKTISNQHSVESQDNDQPDYDSVASDEDTDLEPTASKANRQKSLDSDLSDGPVTVQEFMEVKNALVASEAKIQQLMKVNNNLSDELRIMQKKLQTLQSENSNLRKQATTNIYQVQTGSEYTDTSNHSSLKRRPSARGSRPMSMYETGSGQKPYLPMGEVNHPEESRTRLQPFPAHASRLEKQNSTPESDYDNTPNDTDPDDTGSGRKGRQRSVVWQGDGSVPDTAEPHAAPSPILPSTEDVIRKTEQITKNIQELLRAAQENKHDSYIPCSERIHVAVTEMAALFPKKPKSDTVRTSLRLLTSSAYRLQSECKKTLPGDAGPPTDIQLVTQQVIQCAYDIAKAAKQLVTITTKENNN
ncbi:ARF GTPase-activating protein GIT2 isoform X3 [Panthera pardus]|uniref:Arf-GAP domain-containing protein n=5 Tax=Felidae TaxID=9681 RepID=A0ABI7YAA1_FELCA|nr:ARF GTPase-activating protein GIT2 isoform X3 [Panthera pardus]XP_023097291.1 ARF GTPase-activating protein GIT2 isoform X4 [Felis catus]XP_030192167.1 ARF GTPase-activating protein GIT2 isoform X4 [Lynx canadensis]XP_042767284.1 ARF GTPase-activating protein GIT2 isoform X10 [Panthera leo]XP_042818902.1 ARF GTPase-activating protein GIT2 isoform X10 [Panthera tigris]XP_045315124.1 ARF GTPase-activating protein GIT2 isoform X9 [Leopardus geoffroyi]XP_046944161.1 ARF GTPase-activating prote